MAKRRSDDPIYGRKPLSNYEGFKRLDKSLEKLELQARGREKVCDVCQKRCRAWRIVPATFGTKLGPTKAGLSGGLTGRKFVVACDGTPDACAPQLERMGVPAEAIREQEAIDRIGLVLPS